MIYSARMKRHEWRLLVFHEIQDNPGSHGLFFFCLPLLPDSTFCHFSEMETTDQINDVVSAGAHTPMEIHVNHSKSVSVNLQGLCIQTHGASCGFFFLPVVARWTLYYKDSHLQDNWLIVPNLYEQTAQIWVIHSILPPVCYVYNFLWEQSYRNVNPVV